jgi:hypothetical protein
VAIPITHASAARPDLLLGPLEHFGELLVVHGLEHVVGRPDVERPHGVLLMREEGSIADAKVYLQFGSERIRGVEYPDPPRVAR